MSLLSYGKYLTISLESGVKTTISACERFELVDFAEYVVDQVL